jgi:Predicted transcriptional regulators
MFSENLKNLRNKTNITQEKLSNDLFVTHQTISKWENGKSYPDLGMLIKLAKYFNITVDELVSVEEYEKAKEHGNIKKDSLNLFINIISIILLTASIIGIVVFSILFNIFNFHIPYLIWLIVSIIVFIATALLFFFIVKKNSDLRKAIYRTIDSLLIAIFSFATFLLCLDVYQSRDISFQYNSEFFILLILMIVSILLFIILILLEKIKKHK